MLVASWYYFSENLNRWFEKHILNNKLYNVSDFKIKKKNASDFDLTVLQRVRIWMKKYYALDFEFKIFRHVRF